MLRPTLRLSLFAVALAAAGCRASPTPERFAEWHRGALIRKEVRSYEVIDSAHRGRVGFLKTYDVTEGGGPSYPWRYVYDNDWNELGFIDQFGSAYAYHVYTPSEQAQQNETLRAMRLPSDSIEDNVLRMLGIDTATDSATFHPATRDDIAGAPTKAPLAGPGVVPAKGAAAAPKAEGEPKK